jgi:hypothetical protein
MRLKEDRHNPELNTTSITKTYYNPKNPLQHELLPPKADASIRVIEVDPIVIKALEKIIAKQNPIISTRH